MLLGQPGGGHRPAGGGAALRHLDHRRQLPPHRPRGRLHPRGQRHHDPVHRPRPRGGRPGGGGPDPARGRGGRGRSRARGAGRPPERRPVPARRPGRRRHALHLGHHRPTEGREAPAAVDPRPDPDRGVGAGRHARPRRPGPAPRHRAAVPRRPARLRGHRPRQRRRAGGDAAVGRGAVPRAHPGAGRPQQPRRADDVRAPAAAPRRGASRVRPVVAVHRAARGGADRAHHQAQDDRVVGPGAHGVLGEHRGRRVHAGRLRRRGSPSRAPWARPSPPTRCSRSTPTASGCPPGEVGTLYTHNLVTDDVFEYHQAKEKTDAAHLAPGHLHDGRRGPRRRRRVRVPLGPRRPT